MGSIQSIYAGYVTGSLASFEERPPSVDEMANRRAAILAAGLPYLVAERSGAVAGYAYATPYRPRPAYRYTLENSVYVSPDMRRTGIGKVLMETLIARCEEGMWRQMLAVIGDSANLASIGLHASLGFEVIGTFRSVGFKLGQWVDTVLMQRPLSLGGSYPPVPYRPTQNPPG
jgi:L-amino acid N-acyltransferase YncA